MRFTGKLVEGEEVKKLLPTFQGVTVKAFACVFIFLNFFFCPFFFNVDFEAMMSCWCSCPTKLVKRTLGEARGKRSKVHSSWLKVFCVFPSVSTIMTWTVAKILSTDNPSLHRSRSGRSTRGTLRDSGQSGSLLSRKYLGEERTGAREGDTERRLPRRLAPSLWEIIKIRYGVLPQFLAFYRLRRSKCKIINTCVLSET